MRSEKRLINVSHLLAVIMLFAIFAAPVLQAQLIATGTLTKLGDGSYQAAVSVRNNGTTAAQNVLLGSASLGAAPGSVVPQSIGSIPAGGVSTATVQFGATAGSSGALVIERFAGTFDGGSFATSLRAVLPQLSANMVQLLQLIPQAQALRAGSTEFPIQVSNVGDGSDVNKAFPWVTAAEAQALDDAIAFANNALLNPPQVGTAITNLQSAMTTFSSKIKADGSDPYFRLDPGLGKQLITLTSATNAWTFKIPPLDSRIPGTTNPVYDGSTFQMIDYPFADNAGQAKVLQINYVFAGKTTFGGVSMQSPLSPAVNVPTGSTIEFDVYYPMSAQGKLMRWRMTNRSTTTDSYLRGYDYTSLNPQWTGSYLNDTWRKTHVSIAVPQTGTSSNFILELHGENSRPAESTTVLVQNLTIKQPDPNGVALPTAVNTQNYSVVNPIKGLYNTANNLFTVGALGAGTVTGIRAKHYEIFLDGNNLKADATQPRGPSWLTSTTGAAISGASSVGLAQFNFPDNAYIGIRDSGTPGQYKIHGHVMAWYNQAPGWMTQIAPATLPKGYNGTPNFYAFGNGVSTTVPVSIDMARRVQFNHIVYLMRHFLTTSTFYGSSVSRGVIPFNDWDILNEEVHESNFATNIPADPNSWRASLKHTNWLVAMSDNLISGDLADHYVYLLFKFAHIAAPNAQMAAAFKANYASLPDYMKQDGHDDNGSIDAYIQANPPRLTYNDYSLNTAAKGRTVYNMVKALNTRWLSDPLYDGRPLIEIVGSETHDGVSPTEASSNQYALALYASLIDQHLLTAINSSEFDLLVGTAAPGGSAIAPAALNVRQADALGYQYALMYKLFSKFAPYMDHVLSWGTSGAGWQGSYLLFDGSSNANAGYYGAMNPDRFILGHSYLDSYFSGEYQKVQPGYVIDLGDLGTYTR